MHMTRPPWMRNRCRHRALRPVPLQHARPRRRPSHGAAGVTLVELLIVMTVIGIMAGIAAPFIDVTDYRTRAAIRELGSTFLAAQRLAVTRQHHVIVAFDVDNNRIRIHEDANNDGRIDEGELVRFVELAEGIVFGRGGAPARPMGSGPVVFNGRQDGLPSVTFQRNGAASEAGGFYVTSTRDARTGSYAKDARAIEIERSTGRAMWFRYTPSGWQREF